MFHKTNLGKFGNSLPCDRAGFVPEAGDRFDAFDFGGDLDEDDFDDFDDFRDEAVEATERAQAALDEWRESAP